MSEEKTPRSLRKLVMIVAITWILSLVTTLIIVYYAPANLGNGTLSSQKLAPYSIPFVTAGGNWPQQIESVTSWVDINDMAPALTLDRPSRLVLIFSAEAIADPGRNIKLRVLVGESPAWPYEITLNVGDNTNPYDYPSHVFVQMSYASYSFTFFTESSVGPGTFSIRVQGKVTGGNGYITHRNLAVIALPT